MMGRRVPRERETLEYLAAARRFIRAAGKRVADADEFELAELVALRQELEALGSRMQAAPDLDALRSELREHIEQIVPGTAARVIREEIQALMREMGG